MKKLVPFLVLAAASPLAHADLVISLKSDPGNYVGQGLTQTVTFTPAQVSTTVYSSGDIFVSASSPSHSFNFTVGAVKTSTAQ